MRRRSSGTGPTFARCKRRQRSCRTQTSSTSTLRQSRQPSGETSMTVLPFPAVAIEPRTGGRNLEARTYFLPRPYIFVFLVITFTFELQRGFQPQRPAGQAAVTDVVPSPPPVRAFIFVSRRVFSIPAIYELCMLVDHRTLPTHALAFSATVVHFHERKKSPASTSVHSGGLEPAALTLLETRFTY